MKQPEPVLIPLPNIDFDPIEVSIPWKTLTGSGHQIIFATPNGQMASADPIMVTGNTLGVLKPILLSPKSDLDIYRECIHSKEFKSPISFQEITAKNFKGIILPGGHAKGMREYLESKTLQNRIVDFFNQSKVIGAVCHGTLLAARSIDPQTHRSVLYGRKTTGLTKAQELSAWLLTALWKGKYYRTYDLWMQDELVSYLKSPGDYFAGPMPIFRDSPKNLQRGFTVKDGNYLSARWPGDIYRFSNDYLQMLD